MANVHEHRSGRSATEIDPVCGMTIDPAHARHSALHAGKKYYFCTPNCREKFRAEPERYLRGERISFIAAWTCPMHPEIRQSVPGACPICGMALEAVVPGTVNPEHADFKRRMIAGFLLALPVLALEMGWHVIDLHRFISPWTAQAFQLLFATPVVLWAGRPIFERAAASFTSGQLNMFTLIALGTGIAWGYSLVALALPQIFPLALHKPDGTVDVYFEAACVITVLVLLGQVLELRARAHTSAAIRALMGLAPAEAVRLGSHGNEETLAIEAVRVGDRLRVRPGERVPVDGVVLSGRGTVDESMLTGEAMPVTKEENDKLIGGTLNGTGALVMRADKVGRDTMLARIVALVAEAQRSRAPIQRLADRVASWFVPAVIIAALIAFSVWLAFGREPRLAYALVAAVSVLIIACPCALGLATPLSVMVGIGKGAEAGVLIRNAEALERFAEVDTLVVDKTGTLTEGKPALTGVVALDLPEDELLRLAASLERASEHPIASAILAGAHRRQIALAEPVNVRAVIGRGVQGSIARKAVFVGTAAFLRAHGIAVDALAGHAERARAEGATAVFVAVENRLAGMITIADPIKTSAPGALAALARAGLRIVMLTGDHHETAAAVARKLGIATFEAEVPPERKAAYIAGLRREGRVVAMAGDGINDAPALALADVGIAMGTGTDVALASAAITLVKGDLMGIVRARTLSRATLRNIRQNLVFAFAYNAAGVPIAGGALFPVFGILLSPALAAAAMTLSSLSVIANALRLRRVRL